jgi:nitrogen fixation NifU-like protein
MSDLRELYQEVILDHNRSPRNFGELPGANRRAEGYNPLCGDKINLELLVDGDRITDLRFEGVGCAISTASASIMTQALKGKTLAEADALFQAFHDLVTGQLPEHEDLGKLEVFAGVSEYPARVKCAILAWHTLRAALQEREEPVSTE